MKEDVVVGSATNQRGDGLVHVCKGRDLHLDAILFGKLLHDLLPDVLFPVVDLQRDAALRLEPIRDRRVVLEDGKGDRIVGTGELERWALSCDGSLIRARCERRDPGKSERCGTRASQKRAPVDAAAPVTA